MSSPVVETKSTLSDFFRNTLVYVRLSDNRVVKGKVECLDNERNVILGEAYQIEEGSAPHFMGYVMVPGKYIASVEVEADKAI